MSTNFNNNTITKQDAIAEYERHLRESNQGYFKAMERYNRVLSPHIGENAFSNCSYLTCVNFYIYSDSISS